MVWLNPVDYKKQEYMELRLNAPLGEHIRLDFNPQKFLMCLIMNQVGKTGTVIESHYVYIVQILIS